MGALHDGHLSLVRRRRQHARHVVVSIFVNPTQFAPHEDFDAYPRTLEADREKLAAADAALIFAPSARGNVSGGFATTITVDGPGAGTGKRFPAAFLRRRRHRRGQAADRGHARLWRCSAKRTISNCWWSSGWCAIWACRREIIAAPIAREADGLAMSSRNAYLDAGRAQGGGQLNLVLKDAIATACARRRRRRRGEGRWAAALKQAGFDSVDYVALRDARNPGAHHRRWNARRASWRRRRSASTRLIDNMAVPDCGEPHAEPRMRLIKTQRRQFLLHGLGQSLGAFQPCRYRRAHPWDRNSASPGRRRAAGASPAPVSCHRPGRNGARLRASAGASAISLWRAAIWPLITQ